MGPKDVLQEPCVTFSDVLVVGIVTVCIEYTQETFDQLDNPVFLNPIQLGCKFRTKALMP